MRAIRFSNWHEYLLQWAGTDENVMARSPRRNELTIQGELPSGDGSTEIFNVGRSRDPLGTVIHLNPSQTVGLLSKGQHKEKAPRLWNQWWAKIAVRAGYMMPVIDPAAIALLSSLRFRDARVEFIVDTNVLISGVGHWLVRWFGDVCDLVRTVVTDLEVQRFVDSNCWHPKDFNALSTRASYLTSSRFLEFLREQHPVWRRLDTEEETSLFVAKASHASGKEPGSDTLLLRAARRAIQEQVPGLVRLFVTSDQPLARAALHDLPHGSTIAAYVNPIPATGIFLSSIHWWPRAGKGSDIGGGFLSNLGNLLYEMTCICDALRVVKSDGSSLRLRSFIPGRNQFPSDWLEPVVWVEHFDKDGALFAAPTIPKLAVAEGGTPHQFMAPRIPSDPQEAKSRVPAPSISIKSGSRTPPVESSRPLLWPLKDQSLRPAVFCAARATAVPLLDALTAIMFAVKEKRSLAKSIFSGGKGPIRELKTVLKAVGVLNPDGQPGPHGPALVDIYNADDIDGLSNLLSAASAYGELILELRKGPILLDTGTVSQSRTRSALLGIARTLGQAVQVQGAVVNGSNFVSRSDFLRWFRKTVDDEAKRTPLGEVPVAKIAERALQELEVSPARLERALRAAGNDPQFTELEFTAGGTPELVMPEDIAELSPQGWKRRKISADGLMGYRAVRSRTR